MQLKREFIKYCANRSCYKINCVDEVSVKNIRIIAFSISKFEVLVAQQIATYRHREHTSCSCGDWYVLVATTVINWIIGSVIKGTFKIKTLSIIDQRYFTSRQATGKNDVDAAH
jgi:hypothetical protein